QLQAVQQEHWWFRHRQRLLCQWLDPLFPKPVTRVLDFGCGSGSNLSLLGSFGPVVGLDPSLTGLTLAKGVYPQASLVQGDGNQVARLFAPASFDLIGVFGVLYHQNIQDPLQVLQQLQQLLAPGGYLLLAEAAFPMLYRQHDRQAAGARRFHPRQMVTLLEEAGLLVERSTCWNLPAFFPAALLALVDNLLLQEGDTIGELTLPPVWLNQFLYHLLTVESWMIGHGVSLPLGVSLMCLARKADETANCG
ncbi:MAG: class I SAM-dependent methyltransferase, partial [Magnetococcales bacterium]|nr:class I SAM-dependent methyltransferase [Magnetococcales bacterium]